MRGRGGHLLPAPEQGEDEVPGLGELVMLQVDPQEGRRVAPGLCCRGRDLQTAQRTAEMRTRVMEHAREGWEGRKRDARDGTCMQTRSSVGEQAAGGDKDCTVGKDGRFSSEERRLERGCQREQRRTERGRDETGNAGWHSMLHRAIHLRLLPKHLNQPMRQPHGPPDAKYGVRGSDGEVRSSCRSGVEKLQMTAELGPGLCRRCAAKRTQQQMQCKFYCPLRTPHAQGLRCSSPLLLSSSPVPNAAGAHVSANSSPAAGRGDADAAVLSWR